MLNRFFLILGLSISSFSVQAQETKPLINSNQRYNKALILLKDSAIDLSKELFDSYIKENVHNSNTERFKKAKLYSAYCSLKLRDKNSTLIAEKYIENNPENTDKNILYFELANIEFENKNWNKALHYINACSPDFIAKDKQEKFKLYKAYALYKENKLDESLVALKDLETSSTYKKEANFYKSLIYFKKKDWQQTITEINSCKKDIDINRWAKFYTYSNYNLKRFTDVIAFIEKNENSISANTKRDLTVIKGLSFHHLNKHKDVIKELENIQFNSYESEAAYALAFAYHQNKNIENAIKFANTIQADSNSTDYTNAQFLLAKIYLENNKKKKAIPCLENVLKNKSSKQKNEIAHYQLIKLSYEFDKELLNTEELVYSFMEEYPKSIFSDEIYGILVQNFIKNKEYEKGIHLLESKQSTNIRLRKLYQEICLYRGVQYYNLNKYSLAKDFLEKSLKEKINSKYTAQANYWLAESLLKLKMPQKAISKFKNYIAMYDRRTDIEENKFAQYHLGHAYFDTKNYPEAIKSWNNFLSKNNIEQVQKTDALLRLGDAYMLTRQYAFAKQSFRKAASYSGNHSDYATYLEAICEDILGNKNSVVQILTNFDNTYPKSIYKDDALFYLAETQFKAGNTKKAYNAYKDIITKYTDSPFLPKAKLKIARINYNDMLYDSALQNYKEIVEEYPNSKFSNQAIQSIKNIYYSKGRAEDFINYINGLENYNVDSEKLDDYAYNSAFKLFKEAKFKESIKAFNYYLGKYPNGYHTNETYFYLATAQLQTEDNLSAENSFEKLTTNSNEFKDESLLKLAKLNYNKKNYKKSNEFYQKLSQSANYDNYKKEADFGLMRTYFKINKMEEVMLIASSILKRTDISEQQKEETKYLLGTSSFYNGSFSIAKKYLEPFANKNSFKNHLEANYILLAIEFNNGKYNTVIENFNQKINIFKKSDSILGKSMLLYAKAHIKLNEKEGAVQILETLINKIEDSKITTEAEELLKSLEN